MHWTKQDTLSWDAKPDHRSRPQTTLKDIWRQIPRPHLQHQTEEPKRENPKIPLQNSSHTGCQKQGPRHHTGDHHPPKMVLHGDIHSIQDSTAIPPPHIPTQLIAGICTADQLHAIRTENQLQESLLSSLHSIHTVNWEQVQSATFSNNNMLLLLSTIEDGIPEFKHQLPPSSENTTNLGSIYTACSDGVVIYKNFIVIPPSLRPSCLSALHAAHQGTSVMTSKAEASIFWPGITNDIQAIRAICPHCNRMAPSQAALPPIPPTLPEYPFQCICADYFHYQGHTYLVIVDRYSNWPIVERAKDGAQGLINVVRQLFHLWHSRRTLIRWWS